jgi:hypothetical protein
MDYDTAMRLLHRARFNAFYAKRCERLSIPVAGPLPDWFEAQQEPLPEELLHPSPSQQRSTAS